MLWEEPQDRDWQGQGRRILPLSARAPCSLSFLQRDRALALEHGPSQSKGLEPKVLPFYCPLVFAERVEIRTGTWASASPTFRS